MCAQNYASSVHKATLKGLTIYCSLNITSNFFFHKKEQFTLFRKPFSADLGSLSEKTQLDANNI